MKVAMEMIEFYTIEIIIGLSIGFFILLTLYLISQIRISKLKSRYKILVKDADKINIEELLLKNGEEIEALKDKVNMGENKIKELNTKLTYSVQKVGFVRYNAFADMGSDLSFSIVFLDGFSNGFVLTSIYGREQSTCYAKPIKNGKSTYSLSAEEMQAMYRAIKGESQLTRP